MNTNVKAMFEDLCDYCEENDYRIIEVYFQDNKALLFDHGLQERFIADYEAGEWV